MAHRLRHKVTPHPPGDVRAAPGRRRTTMRARRSPSASARSRRGCRTNRQVSAKAATSSFHDALSKSAARNQHVSSSRSGLTPRHDVAALQRGRRQPQSLTGMNAWRLQSLHFPRARSGCRPGLPLVRAGRGVAWLAGLLADEPDRKDVQAAPEGASGTASLLVRGVTGVAPWFASGSGGGAGGRSDAIASPSAAPRPSVRASEQVRSSSASCCSSRARSRRMSSWRKSSGAFPRRPNRTPMAAASPRVSSTARGQSWSTSANPYRRSSGEARSISPPRTSGPPRSPARIMKAGRSSRDECEGREATTPTGDDDE